MNTKISKLMTADVVSVVPSTTLEQCAAVMDERRISSLVVTENGLPVGILTERDMLSALSCRLLGSTMVGRVMGKPLVTVREDVSYREAVRLFGEHSIRHLVVVGQGGELAGIVSETDLCRKGGIVELLGRRVVVDAMDQNPVLLPHDTEIAAAAMWMGRGRQSSVFVVTGAKPVGILTERDMVRQYRQGAAHDVLAERIMSAPVATILSDQSLTSAVQQMKSMNIRHLAVVDGAGEIVGQLSENDILRGVSLS
ncbi:CBS domain-containing protein [Ferriphaselus sp. R-1]|uniref:CBS domain-containing protein n=1 Tax=Ferriphaselus sp. R-1 TaxID=1485544 RepID=UPI0005555A19|nr:CBS domain-containing protein [Ferriphaselus sp. R-1]